MPKPRVHRQDFGSGGNVFPHLTDSENGQNYAAIKKTAGPLDCCACARCDAKLTLVLGHLVR